MKISRVSKISITPNPVNAGAGLLISVEFVEDTLTWKMAAAYRWKQLKAYLWGDS